MDEGTVKNALRRIWRRKALDSVDFLTAMNFAAARSASPHLHSEYTISVVESGVLSMDFRDIKLNLKPGEFLVIGPEMPHTFDFSQMKDTCVYRTVYLGEDALPQWLVKKIRVGRSDLSCFSNRDLWEGYI